MRSSLHCLSHPHLPPDHYQLRFELRPLQVSRYIHRLFLYCQYYNMTAIHSFHCVEADPSLWVHNHSGQCVGVVEVDTLHQLTGRNSA